MEAGVSAPVRRARSIFHDLGYSISGDGPEFTAQRKWRVVRVTATAEADDPDAAADTEAELRCFVTWADSSDALCDRLRRADPDYEWAVIGVREDGYDVFRAEAAR